MKDERNSMILVEGECPYCGTQFYDENLPAGGSYASGQFYICTTCEEEFLPGAISLDQEFQAEDMPMEWDDLPY